MAEEYKICLAGTATQVVGTENIKSLADIEVWFMENQEYYEEGDPQKPASDGSKYVYLPIDMSTENA